MVGPEEFSVTVRGLTSGLAVTLLRDDRNRPDQVDCMVKAGADLRRHRLTFTEIDPPARVSRHG